MRFLSSPVSRSGRLCALDGVGIERIKVNSAAQQSRDNFAAIITAFGSLSFQMSQVGRDD
jgi:hypothetical protein